MGRRMFLRHLEQLQSPGAVTGIQSIQSREEGVVSCRFTCRPNENEPPIDVDIQLCGTDLDEYPDGNSFMIFTNDESLNGIIPNTLQDLSGHAHGQSISSVLKDVSQRLTQVVTCGLTENSCTGTQFEEADFDFEEDSDLDFGFVEPPQKPASDPRAGSFQPSSSSHHPVDPGRIRTDLTAVKQAGFRIGALGNLERSGILCISIRIVKLGLSEEAMQAWNLQRKHYLLLMISYPEGYRDIDQVKEDSSLSGLTQMRVGLCDHYKPQLADVLSLFQASRSEIASNMGQRGSGPMSTLEPLFIDKPLNQLLHDFLPPVIKARLGYALSWLGAEKFIQARQVAASNAELGDMSKFEVDDVDTGSSFPAIVMEDHLAKPMSDQLSLPLAAMQFVLRHFTRCTEFCLVCHCRIEDSFGALKPYVCTKPLCLYQYMSLGFGPRIEREIVSQPHVVDLLISFCYFAAQNLSLKVLPVGMSFPVALIPFQENPVFDPGTRTYVQPPSSTIKESFKCEWKLSQNTMHIGVDDSLNSQKLRPGCWVFLVSDSGTHVSNCRVRNIQLPLVELGDAVLLKSNESTLSWDDHQGAPERSPHGLTKATGMPSKCYMYEHNFDDLSSPNQHQAIQTLLATLPSVEDMRKYLLGKGQDAELRGWSSKISDSALNVLRWIIASNRSCIMQLNQLGEDGCFQTTTAAEDRVGGMENWIQFRFAQGAPDKEKRFIDCVAQETKLTSEHPTLFAWHGSSLRNWHSIIRQGLRFDEIVNGRAFGNGVYMSPHASTSLGYSSFRTYGPVSGTAVVHSGWKQSNLQIMNAFSLNEVVNRTDRFVHTNPHYVVSNIDWIQTRYLFVKSSTPTHFPGQPSQVYEQDPSHRAFNEQQEAISIPITAISKSRRPGMKIELTEAGSTKRNKMVVITDQATAERLEDDARSIASDDEDLNLFVPSIVEDCEIAFGKYNGLSSLIASPEIKGKKRSAEDSGETDFVPGSLNTDGIRFLDPPNDATRTSTQSLMRAFRGLLEVQEGNPLSRLGWYIDSNLVNNMYQWIVELHSFPPHLPLSQDMKAAGLTSVVLEMRFSSNYPFTPPFIRVVKPRFLPFGQGGGGNVTEGGAMCMEILTNNGWTAAQAIDGLLLQVRMAICDEERPARLATRGDGGVHRSETYGVGEAVAAYIRACRNHGWTVPDGFEKLGLE